MGKKSGHPINEASVPKLPDIIEQMARTMSGVSRNGIPLDFVKRQVGKAVSTAIKTLTQSGATPLELSCYTQVFSIGLEVYLDTWASPQVKEFCLSNTASIANAINEMLRRREIEED